MKSQHELFRERLVAAANDIGITIRNTLAEQPEPVTALAALAAQINESLRIELEYYKLRDAGFRRIDFIENP